MRPLYGSNGNDRVAELQELSEKRRVGQAGGARRDLTRIGGPCERGTSSRSTRPEKRRSRAIGRVPAAIKGRATLYGRSELNAESTVVTDECASWSRVVTGA